MIVFYYLKLCISLVFKIHIYLEKKKIQCNNPNYLFSNLYFLQFIDWDCFLLFYEIKQKQ